MDIKVSVIVPCYNVEKYVRECIQSICNQTLEEIEIICINDGSKDNTLSIINEFKKKDKRIKVINKENTGYGHSVNFTRPAACRVAPIPSFTPPKPCAIPAGCICFPIPGAMR